MEARSGNIGVGLYVHTNWEIGGEREEGVGGEGGRADICRQEG